MVVLAEALAAWPRLASTGESSRRRASGGGRPKFATRPTVPPRCPCLHARTSLAIDALRWLEHSFLTVLVVVGDRGRAVYDGTMAVGKLIRAEASSPPKRFRPQFTKGEGHRAARPHFGRILFSTQQGDHLRGAAAQVLALRLQQLRWTLQLLLYHLFRRKLLLQPRRLREPHVCTRRPDSALIERPEATSGGH